MWGAGQEGGCKGKLTTNSLPSGEDGPPAHGEGLAGLGVRRHQLSYKRSGRMPVPQESPLTRSPLPSSSPGREDTGTRDEAGGYGE